MASTPRLTILETKKVAEPLNNDAVLTQLRYVVSGEEIAGLEEASDLPDVVVFHAGTNVSGDRVVTAGGRVLNVCATGSDLAEALSKAYDAADRISWPGKRFSRAVPVTLETIW